MSFYRERILPPLIDRVCSADLATRQRQQLIPRARGRILEIGMGSGLNLPFYRPENVEHLWGLEPSEALLSKARERAQEVTFPVTFLRASAEAIPLPDASVDTVVTTYTLCSIEDLPRALKEVYRVLVPGGRLLFCEHGRAPEPSVERWQRRLTPIWKRFSGGCHLDRDIRALLQEAGFEIEEMEQEYVEGPRIFTYHYRGTARKPTTEL